MNQQLALAIRLNDEATLEDFHWSNNLLLHQHLQRVLENVDSNHLLYLWGVSGSGKSHLMQACCQTLTQGQSVYLPLHTVKELSPELIEDLDKQTLLCIDDIDAIAGLPHWEEALFHLYNKIRDNAHSKLIISGRTPPSRTAIQLADLKSRLAWGLVIQLEELCDDNKIKTLQNRAKKRGFELPTSVIQFLINHCARNMHDLNHLLNRLDETSLAAQRKITIPFVKQALGL